MNEQQIKELANQSVARLQQIKTTLLEADKLEIEALGKVAKSSEDNSERRLEVERDYLRMRMELCNEQFNVACQLLNFSSMPSIDDPEVKALAKDADLAAKLRDKRQQAESEGHSASKGACGSCDNCTTSCTVCFTNACYTCITDGCLTGYGMRGNE